LTILGEVSDAYHSLKNLAVEAAILAESGDEKFCQSSEQRVCFYYAALDRIRYQKVWQERNHPIAARSSTAAFRPQEWAGCHICSGRSFLSAWRGSILRSRHRRTRRRGVDSVH
jgi:hypothetical protein